MSAPLLEVRDLRVHFPVTRGVWRRRAGAVRAVDGVSFEIREGRTLGLVGESGSGKSTTGRAILRLLRPTGGRVRLAGTDLGALSAAELRRARQYMQMIFQDPYASLNPRLTVGAMIREPMDLHGVGTPAERRRRVAELLERVGLGGRLDHYPAQLSGGEQQRVGIARAFANQPDVLFADEPTGNLDSRTGEDVLALLEELVSEGRTLVLVTHEARVRDRFVQGDAGAAQRVVDLKEVSA